MVLAMTLIAASCAPNNNDNAVTTRQTPVSDTAETSEVTASTAVTSTHPATVLTCADSIHAGTPANPDDVNAAGLSFSGIDPVRGRKSDPPLVSDGTTTFRFEKVFLYVSTHASATTKLTLISPPDALLYYTDQDTWQAHIKDADLIRASTKTLTIARCDTDLTGYFGGVLLASGNCLQIELQGDSPADREVVNLPLPGPC